MIDDTAAEHFPTPSAPERPGKMLRGVKWFAAEFFVVVAGIVAALVLQAWWSGRSDRAREAAYLAETSADLSETERLLVDGDSKLRPVLMVNSQLLRAFHMVDPPADSIGAWLIRSLQFNEYQPVVGSMEALVATGDLALIQDAALRAEITKYLDQNRNYVLVQHNYSEEWRRGWALLHSHVDVAEVLAQVWPQKMDSLAHADSTSRLPPHPLRHRFPFDPNAFLADRDAYQALEAMNTGLQGMTAMRAEMLRSERALKEHISSDMRRK